LSPGLAEVRAQPKAVEAVLANPLAGPCAQAGDDGQQPLLLLLILDDLEQWVVVAVRR
jgi:hypothetical protein